MEREREGRAKGHASLFRNLPSPLPSSQPPPLLSFLLFSFLNPHHPLNQKKIDASNNAGDRAWHWADNMGHDAVKRALEAAGADTSPGPVLVQDHVPKVRDFFSKACWAHHPKPYGDWLAEKRAYEAALDAEEAAGRIAGL
jgi:hypothetical protein